MRPKHSNKTLTNLDLEKEILELDNCKTAKMLDGIGSLLEMSLRFKRSPPILQTIREIPGIARRPRTRHDLRLRRNLPFDFMIVRPKPEQSYVFRILPAVSSKFHLLTWHLKKSFSNLNGAKPTIYAKTTDKNNTSRSPQKICSKLKLFE